ncbi:VWA domain-containing protein [Priestia koreensis]|uniref:VWA domain-containing protein n=1 Tax=Priestia koreensis TaxID=284581 RepID=UPI00203ADBA1|nr:VWA domain-containing protein [Priestia koreensis]MCM3005467.1 VWA domain-containing protein [Priestia koreensis]
MSEQMKKWRLILGEAAERTFNEQGFTASSLSVEERLMDEALHALYEGDQQLGRSIKLSKWLGDVRTLFPSDIVSVIQQDAIEKRGLTQLLFEPETLKSVTPSIEMVATLMALKGHIPEQTKETARELIATVVEEIKSRLENDIQQAVKGVLNRKQRTPLGSGAQSIDWKYTIQRNLKNYDRERKVVIPERFYFYERERKSTNWTIILDIDQSGSMADSVIYASIIGSIFASLPALNTHVIAFDTEVVDLTEQCQDDPVDMLFGIQLGGGTDINRSLGYCKPLIENPDKTIFILISDLYENGNEAAMMRKMKELKEDGVKVISLLALSDDGVPSYDERNARRLASMGIPCFGCSPKLLPELIEQALKGEDLSQWKLTNNHK